MGCREEIKEDIIGKKTWVNLEAHLPSEKKEEDYWGKNSLEDNLKEIQRKETEMHSHLLLLQMHLRGTI